MLRLIRSCAIALLALAFVVSPGPRAEAAVLYDATCVATISMNFSPALTEVPGSGGFSFSGGGPCVGTGAIPLSSFGMSGGGSVIEGSCSFIAATGLGGLNYTGASPAAISTVMVGNILSNATFIVSGFPVLAGAGVLALSPDSLPAAEACATSLSPPIGAAHLTFIGTVTFSDPTLTL